MFSNGTNPDSAVNYRAPTALCGAAASGAPTMNIPANDAALTLPLNTPGCTQRIGMTWVAKVTNWLAFLYDRAGVNFAPGASCDDPLLLYKAVDSIAKAEAAAAAAAAIAAYKPPSAPTIVFPGPGNVFPVNGYCLCEMETPYGASPSINAGDILPLGQPFPGGGGAVMYVATGTGAVAQPPGTFMCIGALEVDDGGSGNYWTVLAIRIA